MKIDEQEFVQYLTIKKHLSPKTVKSYKIRFSVVQKWLVENKTDLNKISFEKFLFELKKKELSNSAINTYIQTIKHLDGFCKDRGLPTGFTEGIDNLPKTHSDINILSIDEINLLVNTSLDYKNRNGVDCGELDRKYRAFMHFLAITGSRFEEAASLKIKRVDIDNGRATLVNTKNKDNRFIYFEGPVKEELRSLIKDRLPEELVFTNSRGQNIKPGDYNDDLRLRAKKAGITKHVHAHLLRHCFATNLIVAGVDIAIVATLLGHRDIKTTYETYVHLADDTLKKSAMRNPLLRKFVQPAELIKIIKDTLESFHLADDQRFEFQISESDSSLQFQLKARSIA